MDRASDVQVLSAAEAKQLARALFATADELEFGVVTTDEQREQRRAYYLRYRERITRQQREYYEHYRRSDAGKAVKRREQAKLWRIPAPRGGIPWTTADDAIVCRADLTLFEMAEMSPDRGTCDSPDSTADHPTDNAASLQQS